MKKQLTALLLAGALALSAAVVPASAASVEQFTDVPSGSWFFSHVEYATEKGLLNGVHAVAAGMAERGHGTIINISSVAGRKTFPNHVAYVGTKFAVHGLSENLREELSPHNVRVVTIAPGAVETELLSHTTDEGIKSGYQDWKADMGGKVLAAEDVANAVYYAYSQPPGVCIREIVLAATRQQA